MRNLEDEVQMYKNRVVQADSEVIYLKNALRIREEEAKLLHLTERVGAYRNLEQRFVTAMRQNADAQDYVDQLEHLIMQLQGETETIGKPSLELVNMSCLWYGHNYWLQNVSCEPLNEIIQYGALHGRRVRVDKAEAKQARVSGLDWLQPNQDIWQIQVPPCAFSALTMV